MEKQTIGEALKRASFLLRNAGIDDPRFEAEMLLANLLSVDRLKLLCVSQESLDQRQSIIFEELLQRRCSGEPAAYIVGHKYFYGRLFYVNKNVLIPRPETELVIDVALKSYQSMNHLKKRPLYCLDLGTGCGALAITLALELPGSIIYAVDLCSEALEIAAYNATMLGATGQVHFVQGDYYSALREESVRQFDLIISNPPYIKKADLEQLPRSIRHYEPRLALEGGMDGLDAYRRIINGSPAYLRSRGALVVEIGHDQEESVSTLYRESGQFKVIKTYPDLAGHQRVIAGFTS